MAEVVLEDECKEALTKIGRDHGFRDIEIRAALGSKTGDNYMGTIYRVWVKGKRDGHAAELQVIMKTCPNNVSRETLPTNEVFQRECLMYNIVLRELERIQQVRYIDPRLKFSFVKCFYASDEYMHEMLIMEDLSVDGFTMADRFKTSDYDHTSLVMSSLAKLHALSYVMKHNKPNLFEELASRSPDILCSGVLGKAIEVFLSDMSDMFVSVIKCEQTKSKMEKFTSDIFERIQAAVKPNRFSVIGHGDCWINNMLFKYEKGVPVDIRLLDFQLMRYGSPVLDILYFIFSCTDKQFRSLHYTTMLDTYHSSLSESLKAHSLDVNDFLSKEDLILELEQHSDFGIGMATLTLRTFAADADDATDIETALRGKDRVKVGLPTGEGYERFVKRVNDVAEDFDKYGYLD